MESTIAPDMTLEFVKLRRIFGQLIDAQAGTPIGPDEGWQNHAQVLLIKVFRHLESIETIYAGINTSHGDDSYPLYVDHASIAVLVRAAFESYMMFHFIFCAKSPELSRLRYKVWKYVGLRGRQALHGTVIAKTQWQQVIAADKKSIQVLAEEIRADRLFTQYTKEIQDRVLKKNDAKMGMRWMDLAEQSGFPRKYAHDMYHHFCNYAHADLVSVLQIHDAAYAGDHKKLAGAAISFCTLLMGQIIDNYAQLFPNVNRALQSDPEALGMLDRWRSLLASIGGLYANGKNEVAHG